MLMSEAVRANIRALANTLICVSQHLVNLKIELERLADERHDDIIERLERIERKQDLKANNVIE